MWHGRGALDSVEGKPTGLREQSHQFEAASGVDDFVQRGIDGVAQSRRAQDDGSLSRDVPVDL